MTGSQSSPSTRPVTIETHTRRTLMVAMFAAGIAVFLVMYVTQGLLPEIGRSMHSDPTETSLTVSLLTAGVAIGLIPISSLAERFGRVPTMIIGICGAVILAFLLPLLPSIEWMNTARFVQGLFIAAVPATAMAHIAKTLPRAHATDAIGTYLAGNTIGGLCSRLLTGVFADLWGWRTALFILAGISLLAGITFVIAISSIRSVTHRSRPVPIRDLFGTLLGHLTNPALLPLYAIGFFAQFLFGGAYTALSYRLEGPPFHLTEAGIGAIFLLYLLGTVVTQRSGKITRRIGITRALLLGAVTIVAGWALTLIPNLVAVIAGLGLITAAFFLVHSTASATVSVTAERAASQASAIYLTAYYLGNSFGATLCAAAFHVAGWDAVTALGAAAAVIIVMFVPLVRRGTAKATTR